MACTTVASWPVGAFAENLAVSLEGEVFVSLHGDRRVDRYVPDRRSLAPFAQFPAPVAGLCFGDSGILWVTGGSIGNPPGYVWRVSPDGRVELWVEIPDAQFMNGCATNWAAYLMSLKSGAEGEGFNAFPGGEISRWD